MKPNEIHQEYISEVMSAELHKFCKANDLPFIDAAELVLDANLTDFQFGWLTAFNTFWDSLIG